MNAEPINIINCQTHPFPGTLGNGDIIYLGAAIYIYLGAAIYISRQDKTWISQYMYSASLRTKQPPSTSAGHGGEIHVINGCSFSSFPVQNDEAGRPAASLADGEVGTS